MAKDAPSAGGVRSAVAVGAGVSVTGRIAAVCVCRIDTSAVCTACVTCALRSTAGAGAWQAVNSTESAHSTANTLKKEPGVFMVWRWSMCLS